MGERKTVPFFGILHVSQRVVYGFLW